MSGELNSREFSEKPTPFSPPVRQFAAFAGQFQRPEHGSVAEKTMCVPRRLELRALHLQRVSLRMGSRTNTDGLIHQIAIYYRGRLSESGVLANGPFEIIFWLHESAAARATPVARREVMVANGVFSVVVDIDGVAGLRDYRLTVGVRRSATPSDLLRLFPQDRLWP